MNPARPRSFGARTGWCIGLLVPLLLSACANPFSRERLDSWSITYKINIQQGVVVTQEMADLLKPGMTRDQVRFVLGTPILTDPFHADRWDYPFRFQPGRGTVETRQFTVFFANDAMTRFAGDKLPTEEEFAASRNFATTKLARVLPVRPAGPPAVGATAPSAGGTTSTTTTVNVPVRPPQQTAPDNADTSVPAPPATDSTPR